MNAEVNLFYSTILISSKLYFNNSTKYFKVSGIGTFSRRKICTANSLKHSKKHSETLNTQNAFRNSCGTVRD